ncbi:MAG: cytochrome c oxidase subunit [Chloroflexi bacterium]|nr:cytochrome c oxidase subunit [Chloroflexota bacterium]
MVEKLKSVGWWKWAVLACIALLASFIPLPAAASRPTDRTFQITARRFEYSPSIITVNPGDRVTLKLTSADVVHGLSIDVLNIKTTINPGQTELLTFVADQQGSFRIRCTETCGNMHPFMLGKLQVGQNTLLWRATALIGLALVGGFWALKN